jgi:hypothetical protein
MERRVEKFRMLYAAPGLCSTITAGPKITVMTIPRVRLFECLALGAEMLPIINWAGALSQAFFMDRGGADVGSTSFSGYELIPTLHLVYEVYLVCSRPLLSFHSAILFSAALASGSSCEAGSQSQPIYPDLICSESTRSGLLDGTHHPSPSLSV